MRTGLVFLLALLCSVRTQGQQGTAEPATLRQRTGQRSIDFSVVPGGTTAFLVIRDPLEIQIRAASIAKQMDDKLAFLFSILGSMAVSGCQSALGVTECFDPRGNVILASYGSDESLVAFVPITSVEAAAKELGLEKEELESGIAIPDWSNGWISRDVGVGIRGKHLIVGKAPSVKLALQDQGLEDHIDQETRTAFEFHDVLLRLNLKRTRELIADGKIDLRRNGFDYLARNLMVDTEKSELATVSLGMQLDEALKGTLLFDFDGPESRVALTKLQNESRKSDLTGLPDGNVIVATSRSGGEQSGEPLGIFANYIVGDLGGLFGIRDLAAPAQIAGMTKILGEGFRQTPLSRAALYENESPEEHGAYCLISVLEVKDSDQFIHDLRDLLPIINVSLDPTKDVGDQINPESIKRMVSFLSHASSRAREFMTVKLRLLGRHALPELRQALDTDDADLRLRVEGLVRQIEADLTRQKTEFLTGQFTDLFRPDLGYIVGLETRGAFTIDGLRMRLDSKQGKTIGRLHMMLGKQWSTIRLARVENQIVVMIGSNTQLFDAAIENVSRKTPGLDSNQEFRRFHRNASDDLMSELHFSIAEALDCDSPKVKPENAHKFSSLGVSITPQRVRGDFFVPIKELNALQELNF